MVSLLATPIPTTPKTCFKLKSYSDNNGQNNNGRSDNGRSNNGRNNNDRNDNGQNDDGNTLILVGKYAGVFYPAISSREGCSYFIDGKVRSLSTCDYLEGKSFRWVSSSNGKTEKDAVVIDNLALGRASLKKGPKWIGRIINSPSFSGLIYSDGVLEYQTNVYEALVCSC